MTPDCTPALFCVHCFASDTDGSWDHMVNGDNCQNYCTNCGGAQTSVEIPRWAVEEIRKNASWVGKRYYPHEEDTERRVELEALRRTIKVFPGRIAAPIEREGDEEQRYRVIQPLSAKKNIEITINADSEEIALNKAKTMLPYVENPDADS